MKKIAESQFINPKNYFEFTLTNYGLYSISNGKNGMKYGTSAVIYSFTNSGIDVISGDKGAVSLEVLDYKKGLIRATNLVNVSVYFSVYKV